jgi:hypothetical protein
MGLDLRLQVVPDLIAQVALDVTAPDERPPLERQRVQPVFEAH